MSEIQKTIFVLCVATFATVYTASITNMSEEDFSAEIEETPSKDTGKTAGAITEYDPMTPSFLTSEESQSNGFLMGKSLVEGLIGMLQIVRQMAVSQQGLKNISFLVANMVSMFAGQYYDTLKKLMPVFSGMITGLLETLR